MTKPQNPKKRKLIDWNKKSGDDASRITKRMQQRAELSDAAATDNDAAQNKTMRDVEKEEHDEGEKTRLCNVEQGGEEE